MAPGPGPRVACPAQAPLRLCWIIPQLVRGNIVKCAEENTGKVIIFHVPSKLTLYPNIKHYSDIVLKEKKGCVLETSVSL